MYIAEAQLRNTEAKPHTRYDTSAHINAILAIDVIRPLHYSIWENRILPMLRACEAVATTCPISDTFVKGSEAHSKTRKLDWDRDEGRLMLNW